MNQDQFRQQVYKILCEVKSGDLSVSRAQRQILRDARRVAKCESKNTEGDKESCYIEDEPFVDFPSPKLP